MTKLITAAEARKRFGELVDRVAYSGDTFEITKYGKPAGVTLHRSRPQKNHDSKDRHVDPELERDLKEFEEQYHQALNELSKR